MGIKEFAAIEKYFTRDKKHPAVKVTVGDDSAILQIPEGRELVTSVDTLVPEVHFLPNTSPFDIGYKSLAISISDLAAMGAEPIAVLLALTLPSSDESWLHSFSKGFFSAADAFQMDLIGGNITQGPLTISTIVYGSVPSGKAILRSAAKTGDLIYVTGTLGDGGLALEILLSKNIKLEKEYSESIKKLLQPLPKISEGLILRNIAHAAIDISDGLAADLKKILQQSNKGAVIKTELLPLSDNLKKYYSKNNAYTTALSSGDDYELCFTIPVAKKWLLEQEMKKINAHVTCIGEVCAEPGLKILDEQNQLFHLKKDGYEHFEK